MPPFLKSVRVLPFFLALFVVPSPADLAELMHALKNLLYLLALFAAAGFLVELLLAAIPPRGTSEVKGKRRQSWRFYVELAGSCVVIFTCLQLLRQQLAPLPFYAVLLMLALRAAEKRGRAAGRAALVISAALLFDFLAGLLSFHIFSPVALFVFYPSLLLIWLPLAGACACMMSTIAAAELLEQTAARQRPKIVREKNRQTIEATPVTLRLRRVYAGLLLLGPSLVGLQVAMHILPPRYQTALLCIPLSLPLLASLKLHERSLELPPSFVRATTGLCLLFAAIILFAGMW